MFWKDWLFRDLPLSVSFPTLYAIAWQKRFGGQIYGRSHVREVIGIFFFLSFSLNS